MMHSNHKPQESNYFMHMHWINGTVAHVSRHQPTISGRHQPTISATYFPAACVMCYCGLLDFQTFPGFCTYSLLFAEMRCWLQLLPADTNLMQCWLQLLLADTNLMQNAIPGWPSCKTWMAELSKVSHVCQVKTSNSIHCCLLRNATACLCKPGQPSKASNVHENPRH